MSTTPTEASDPIAERRSAILSTHAATELARSDLIADYRAAPSDDLVAAHAQLQTVADDLVAAYLDLVPYIALSRCPHSGVVALYPVDIDGLDGLYWRHDAPERPPADPPPTLFALTGAVDLRTGVPDAAFRVQPGPGAPYVLPRLLDDERAVAVLSALTVGTDPAYCIAYYASDPLDQLAVAAEWGTDRWTFQYAQRRSGTVGLIELDSERDFDLAPWIESGKLRWIAPADDALVLRKGLDDCPYLDLDGARTDQAIEDGDLTFGGMA